MPLWRCAGSSAAAGVRRIGESMGRSSVFLNHVATCFVPVNSQLPHDVATEAIDGLLAGERDELHVAGLAGLEAHCGAGGDVEAHAAGFLAVKFQRRVGL